MLRWLDVVKAARSLPGASSGIGGSVGVRGNEQAQRKHIAPRLLEESGLAGVHDSVMNPQPEHTSFIHGLANAGKWMARNLTTVGALTSGPNSVANDFQNMATDPASLAMLVPGPKGGRFERPLISPKAMEAMQQYQARTAKSDQLATPEATAMALRATPDQMEGFMERGIQAHGLSDRTYPMAGARRPEDLMNPARVDQMTNNAYRLQNAAGMARNDQFVAGQRAQASWLDRLGLPQGMTRGDQTRARLGENLRSVEQQYGGAIPLSLLRALLARMIGSGG